MATRRKKKKSPAERGYVRRAKIVAELRAWADSIEVGDGLVPGSASPDWFKISANFYFEHDEPEDANEVKQ